MGITVKKITQTKGIATQQNIHISDRAVLTGFLNANSKHIGSMENLGSFIDIVSVKNDIGMEIENSFLIAEREESKAEIAGQKIKSEIGKRKEDIFQYSYNLPDTFPEKQTEVEIYVIPTSVKTHSCEPEMPCEICEGSGKCTKCDARGFNRCGSCQGSGTKEIRDGNYANGKAKYRKVACASCHGSKKITCSSCKGTKNCGRCDGNAVVTCDRCDGTSFYQQFSYLSTSYKTTTARKFFTPIEKISDVLRSTNNHLVFDDDLIEWKASDTVLFDKRNDAIKKNKYFSEFANNLDGDAGLAANQKLGRVHTRFSNIPITIIDYTFEETEYTMYIVGEDNIVCYEEIPKKHLHRAGIFTRFINLFTQNKRQLAFLYIATYMLNADGAMDKRELILLDMLMRHVMPNPENRQQFINEFCRELSFDEIEPYIKCVKSDPRAVVFAWQCVLQDKKIESSEVEAFKVLTDFCKVGASDIEKLKQKAEKFGTLNDTQLLTEYFK